MDVPFEDTMEETGIEIDNYLDIEESKDTITIFLAINWEKEAGWNLTNER
ncbi:10901_t:CDS:2, partial [Funneliformis mosseae]